MDLIVNPIFQKSIGTLMRAALMLAVPFVVSQGIWTPEEATATLTAIATALSALLWSLLEKYRSQKKLVTALSMPLGSTQRDVELQVKFAPTTPPVTLPKDVAPKAAI